MANKSKTVTAQELADRIARALDIAPMGQYDGAHHKTWVIDQMVRALTGAHYAEWVKRMSLDEDGYVCEWDVGTPP